MTAALRRRRAPVVLALALLALAGGAHAQLRGQVIGVIDGDTIELLADGRPVRIRLAQIDAPERRQPFGTRAKQHLSALAYRRSATVQETGRDRYGRTIGAVLIDGQNVNRAMVAAGMAWAYRRYLTDAHVLDLEHDARAARRGLWADPAPVPPWNWRRPPRKGN